MGIILNTRGGITHLIDTGKCTTIFKKLFSLSVKFSQFNCVEKELKGVFEILKLSLAICNFRKKIHL